MRGREEGLSLPEILVAALLIGIALVPLLHLYPGTLGFNLETEVDTVLSAAAVRKMEELIGALRATTGGTVAFNSVSTASLDPMVAIWDSTHVIPPGLANSVLLVGLHWEANLGETITSVTWDQGGTNQALTLIGTVSAGGGKAVSALYHRVAPKKGTNTLRVVIAGTNPIDSKGIDAGLTIYTGVNQTTPVSGFASATGTTATPTVNVVSAAGELVLDALSADEDNSGTGAGQTQRYLLTTGAKAAKGSTEAGAATVTMSHTLILAGSDWAIGGVSIKAAGAAAPTSGTAACTDLPNCRLVWTIATELSGATPGTLKTVQVVACQDTNGNSACDSGERQVRYDAKITSRP